MKNVFIRKGVFETNSSSTHSISIAKGDMKLCSDRLSISNGVVKVCPGEFGWEYERYYDAETKASYCLTWIYQQDKERHEDLSEQLKRVIQSVMGATVNVVFGLRFIEDSYIDHQSDDVAEKAFVSDDTLRAFIFNPQSLLVTDNDNH